jgi:hypothetical protein
MAPKRKREIRSTSHPHLWPSMGNPAKVIFFRCQCLCVLLIYITCRIFCAKGITVTVSQIFCELLHFEMLVLENLEKVIFIYFFKFEQGCCHWVVTWSGTLFGWML